VASELDDDTALDRDGDGRYRGTVPDRWGVLSGVPNGGFMMCYALRALADTAPPPDPLTMTAHFLRPGRVGPVTVETELVKVGKRNATAAARVAQEGVEVVRALATFGRFADPDAGSPTIVASTPPELPPVDECLGQAAATAPAIAQRFDNRLDPATMGWAVGKPSGEMVIRGWMRLADGRDPDFLAMPLFADALPPPLFNAVTPGWVPTIELTVHFRARPAPGWLRAEFRTRLVSGGLLEEDGELWDESGQLVAMSRQLAVLPR
jgi:acyl-CoA thioesterase